MLADQVGMREELDAALAGGTLKAVQDVVRKMNKKQKRAKRTAGRTGKTIAKAERMEMARFVLVRAGLLLV